MLNKAIIMGRICADPELRQAGENYVTSFTLAVDRDFKNQAGERETDFIDCVAWRSTAEFFCKYFEKGRMAVVEGPLRVRKWTDKDGNNRRNTEIIVENVYFGDSRRSEDNSDSRRSEDNSDTRPQSTPAIPAEDDSELPF